MIRRITYEIFMAFERALRSSSCPYQDRHVTQFLEQEQVYAEQVTDVAHAKLKRPYSDSQHL